MPLEPWLLTPIIFAARVADVSLGTVRTILVFRGRPYVAALIGFFEVLIWLLAAGQVIQNLDRWYYAVAYAGGFAMGNIVGIRVEGKLALGQELVRAISRDLDVELAEKLRSEGYAVTELPGVDARDAPVEVLLIVAKRRNVPGLLERIHEHDPGAIVTISDIKREVAVMPPSPRKRARGFLPTGWRSRSKRK